jgi:hypothetical protein
MVMKKMGQMNMRYKFEIRNTKTGKLIEETKWKEAKCFVIGFMKHLEFMFGHDYGITADSVLMVDTSGTERTVTVTDYARKYGSCEAPGNEDEYGIVIGTGTTTVTTSDYCVETPIEHGAASGKMNYGSTVVGGAVAAGGGCALTISRQFGNDSGAQITIRELCLVCVDVITTYKFLLSRDNVTQAVDDGNTCTALIEISTSV